MNDKTFRIETDQYPVVNVLAMYLKFREAEPYEDLYLRLYDDGVQGKSPDRYAFIFGPGEIPLDLDAIQRELERNATYCGYQLACYEAGLSPDPRVGMGIDEITITNARAVFLEAYRWQVEFVQGLRKTFGKSPRVSITVTNADAK